MEESVSQSVEAKDLDRLSAETLDRLAVSVLKLNGEGDLLWCNAAARAVLAWPAGALGRSNLFRDLIPAARQPIFYGRFRDGVRKGRLDASFTFVFGFEPPFQARVGMASAVTSGQYWIVLNDLVALAPSRQRHATLATEAAQDTVGRRSRAEPIDPSICEREPIHIPGAIQPHATMMALEAATLRVKACSDGLGDLLGRSVDAILASDVADLLPAPSLHGLRAALETEAFALANRPWHAMVRLGPNDRACLLSAHRRGDTVIVELEEAPDRADDYGAATALDAQQAVVRIRSAPTLDAAATACAEEIRAMTQFERVLVYRFDLDWNGEAIAESLVEGYASLLGLRFPASDIPAQARALYTQAPARFVVDRDATPAAILAPPASDNQTVDLTFAQSRALSPIHLEYQRNLGVNGSMSVSILAGGQLWGLVIGHHRQPHYVTPDTRALAGLVTDAFALRLHELASLKAWNEQQTALEVQNELLRRLAGDEDFVAALTDHGGATLQDLVEATGAAVVSDGRVSTVGATPPATALLDLANWLRADLASGLRVFSTADLSEHWAPAQDLRGAMSGLLGVFVGPERQHLLLWFRPEITSTVVWGGDPRKPVIADTRSNIVLPRRSFERWVEERRGQADPWAFWQIAAAEALATAIEGVVLRQGRKIAELSAKQLELTHALDQREILAREIDHRVKNSLQIVAGVMLMQARGIEDAAAKAAFQDTYTRVMSVARVHDALQHATDAETVDLGETVRLLCGDIAASISDSADRLSVTAEAGLMVPSRTAVALALIATELITNAFKYAYEPGERGAVDVSVEARGADGFRLSVRDNGRGLPPNWDTRPRKMGGGLGMRVIRSMLARIEADMKVEATDGQGTCFVVEA